MKFTLNILEKRSDDADRRWPGYMFGGRARTSTIVLIVVFLAVWWVYDTYRPEEPPKAPPAQVVPPGFVPDPNYTWVPRSRVQEPPTTVTVTPTPTTTPPTTTTTTPPTTTTAPPPFVLPTPPCLLPQPFCPPSASPSPPAPLLPLPGPGPAPSSPPPAS